MDTTKIQEVITRYRKKYHKELKAMFRLKTSVKAFWKKETTKSFRPYV